MRVVLINKSDSTGGAAVVSRRLMEALRQEGHDARLLVCEKLSDSPYVELASSPTKIKLKFLIERFKVYIANGFNRTTLFKIDTGEEGLPLWRHPLVKTADAILINWVNQGMLSLKGVAKLLELGKPVIWTMHDMWEMTGICHHAHDCRHYMKECGECPLLGKKASENDLSHDVWVQKERIFGNPPLMKKMAFVAVSGWLKQKASQSSLLKGQRVEVIGNPFDFPAEPCRDKPGDKINLLFGAARLDDPIKGLDTLKAALKIIKEKYPRLSGAMQLRLFGKAKDPKSMEGFDLPVVPLGTLHGEKELEKVYRESHILVSASSYETFGYTLLEAQAYGAVPVSFSQGGQPDVIIDGETGFLAAYSGDPHTRAKNLAEAIVKACGVVENEAGYEKMAARMLQSASENYSYEAIAKKYVSLILQLCHGLQSDKQIHLDY